MPRLLILADTDQLPASFEHDAADLVLGLGDLAQDTLVHAAEQHGSPEIFAVKGNHDPSFRFTPPVQDLHLRIKERFGRRFGGFRGCVRYKAYTDFQYEQDEAAELLGHFPPVEILICHNSPRGIHERGDFAHEGFDALRTYVEAHRPALLLHGHQHVNEETEVAGCRVLGVYGYRYLEI